MLRKRQGPAGPEQSQERSLNLSTRRTHTQSRVCAQTVTVGRYASRVGTPKKGSGQPAGAALLAVPRPAQTECFRTNVFFSGLLEVSHQSSTDNDPSAGSPTETLLRLLLSPSDRVRASSRPAVPALAHQTETNPRPSLNRSIDSSDGRCVQRAGT